MTPLPEVLPSAIATASGDGEGGLRGDNHPLDFLGEFALAFGRLHRRRCRRCLVDVTAVHFRNVVINTGINNYFRGWCLQLTLFLFCVLMNAWTIEAAIFGGGNRDPGFL